MNVPNILSAIRICMVPLFLYFFFNPAEGSKGIAFSIVLLAGLTDFLDGYIARKYKLVTKLGIVLDPVADKLMLLAVLLALTAKGILPFWILLIVAGKESMMLLGALLLHRNHEVVVPANRYGKAATISFYIAVVTVALGESYYMVFMVLFVLLTLFAFFTYSREYRSIRKDNKE